MGTIKNTIAQLVTCSSGLCKLIFYRAPPLPLLPIVRPPFEKVPLGRCDAPCLVTILTLVWTRCVSVQTFETPQNCRVTTRSHPCATFWADESLVLVFHHVVLSKRMGHESSSFWTLFHVVGVLYPFLTCLLPVCATLRGVTFGNQSVLGCLRVKMGIRAVRLHDAFGLWFFLGRYDMLSMFLLRCCMWLWGVWLGRYVVKRVYEAGRSALFEVRLVFGLQHRVQAVLDFASGTIKQFPFRSIDWEVICVHPTPISKGMEHQSSSTSPAEKGTPTDPNREADKIAASRAGNRVSGQGPSIEKMKRITKNNVHRMIRPWFDRPRLLRARTLVNLHYPPKKVAQVCPLWTGSLVVIRSTIRLPTAPTYDARCVVIE